MPPGEQTLPRCITTRTRACSALAGKGPGTNVERGGKRVEGKRVEGKRSKMSRKSLFLGKSDRVLRTFRHAPPFGLDAMQGHDSLTSLLVGDVDLTESTLLLDEGTPTFSRGTMFLHKPKPRRPCSLALFAQSKLFGCVCYRCPLFSNCASLPTYGQCTASNVTVRPVRVYRQLGDRQTGRDNRETGRPVAR